MNHVFRRCTRQKCAPCNGTGEVPVGEALIVCATCCGLCTTRCSGCHADSGRDCMYEALSVCEVCASYEGALLPFCPGRKLTFDEQDAHYKHFCAGTGPFARARFKTIEAAWNEIEVMILKAALGEGGDELLSAVKELYDWEATAPLCAICSKRSNPREDGRSGGIVEPAHEWICNACLLGRVTP